MEVDPGVTFLHVSLVGVTVMSVCTLVSFVFYCRLPEDEEEKKNLKKRKKKKTS